MRRARLLLGLGLLLATARAVCFEGDVHYGLTEWLALQAGFDKQAAQIIATGDQRVDSGDIQFVDPVFMDACVAVDDVGARRAGEHHYPSTGSVAGAPGTRSVSPGSAAASKPALALIKIPANQAGFMLHKFGEALHTLQDSWSHQGVPDIPQPGAFACDDKRAWGHPTARGGWNSHKADITRYWPDDTRAMAKASYDLLTQYPPVADTKRTPRAWEDIRLSLDGFINASTKTEKNRWFQAHGLSDVSFLEGISLPDGTTSIDLKWPGRKLPPLATTQSRQHGVDPDLLDFYNRFFARWFTTEDFRALAAEFGGDADAGRGSPAAQARRAELAARLEAWRLRDHGRVAEIAHSLKPLTTKQHADLDAASKERNAIARYDPPSTAFFPLLPREKDVSPLLPFYVRTVATSDSKVPKAVAVVKLRHVPYDVIGVVAEKTEGRWHIVSIVATVDH